MNLDPAVKIINYKPFLDIRETHHYKKVISYPIQVMDQFKLGPNGAILTALNLFTAQPENIVKEVEKIIKEAMESQIFLIDIPGQI